MVKKILFVGMGSIGRRHLQNIKKIIPKVKVGALRNNETHLNQEFSELIDFEYYNLEEAKKFNPEIVFVTNPTFLHIETALEFVNKVSGIFIEKPVSDDVEKVHKLMDENQNTIIHVACPLRFHPALQFIKNNINSFSKISNIHIVSGSYLPYWRPEQDYRELYCSKKDMGGGVSLDMIHEIDYIRWIFGDIKEGYFGSSKISELDLETEDVSYGIWKLKNGVLCEIHLDYFSKVPERYLKIVTKENVIFSNLIKSSIKIEDNNKTEKLDFEFDRNDMYIDELKYFLNCVNTNNKSFNDLSFALTTLEYSLHMRNNSGFVIL